MSELSHNATIGAFKKIEDSLEDILHVVPYCSEHEQVWSDEIIPVIFDSCSLLDSLWSFQSSRSSCVDKDHFTMKDYFRYYGETMAKRWLVFWCESINIISPFNNWSKNGNYKNGNDSNELSWWTAYTELKHDRLSNRKKATLANSVKSVGALLLAIIKCEYLREEIEHAGWITGFAQRPIGWLGEDSNDTHKAYVAIETKLSFLK